MKQAKKHKSRMLEQYAYEARIKMWIVRWENKWKKSTERIGKKSFLL